MTKPDPLLLQFASTRPADVAELVSDYTAAEIMEFMSSLPAVTAAQVSARLASRVLFDLLEHIEPAIIARMLIDGEHADVLTLVSHLHQSRYASILDSVKAVERKRLTRLFEFPGQTLASLASTNFLRVPADTLCENVANDLIAGDETTELPIFVVDKFGRFIGIVNMRSVISKSHKNKPVSRYLKTVEPLPASMNAASALNASQWLNASSLPVVDAERQIIGAIVRQDLARVVKDSPEGSDPGLEDLFSELSVRYLDLCANVVSLVFKNPKERED